MATLAQLRSGLQARLNTISGLRTYAYMAPKPEPPAACVNSGEHAYDATFEGEWTPQFEVWVFVHPADLVRAQQKLDAYLAPSGATSIPAAIHADPSLGGVADSCRVLRVSRPPALVETASGPLLGAALAVEVFST